MNETFAEVLGLAAKNEDVNFLFELATALENQSYKAEQIDDLLQYLQGDLDGIKAFNDNEDGGYLEERFRMLFNLLIITQEKAKMLYSDLMQLADGLYKCKMQAKEKASNSVTALNGARR